MTAKRAVIGVTGPTHGGFPAWAMTRLALWRAGGKAVRITVDKPVPSTNLDGLVIGGGSDVSPERYGETLLAGVGNDSPTASLRDRVWGMVLFLFRLLFSAGRRAPRIDEARDDLEMGLLRDALERGLPVLGICRGAQLMNVTLGGTLHQDIGDFYLETPNASTILPRKAVEIQQGTKLRTVLGVDHLRVNSLHSQAVRELGEGLRICATESTAVIQAIEHNGDPFVLGVQWHPEYLPQVRRQQRIFRALVRAAE